MAVRPYTGIDQLFKKACELAETPATRRQYRKWERREGKAWAKRDEAHAELSGDSRDAA